MEEDHDAEPPHPGLAVREASFVAGVKSRIELQVMGVREMRLKREDIDSPQPFKHLIARRDIRMRQQKK